jgi:outer membrane protein TolC
VGAGRKLEIAKELLKNVEVRDKALLHKVKHGNSPQIEQTENQRAVLQRRSAWMAAERALQKATLELSLFFRDSDGNPKLATQDQLPTAFPEPEESQTQELNSNTALSEVVSGHPEVKRLEKQNDQIQVELSLSKNQFLPRLDLQLGVSQGLGSALAPTNPTAYSLLAQANAPTEFRVAVVLEFPIFFRSARGRIEAVQASSQKIEAQETLARQRIGTAIQDAIQAMEVSRNRVVLARQELELAKKLEDGERTRFEHGDSTLLLVNIREQITSDTATREVDALSEYFRAQADYRAAIFR